MRPCTHLRCAGASEIAAGNRLNLSTPSSAAGLVRIAEAGVAGFEYAIWYGMWAPAGTPVGVVEKIAADIARALAAPDVRDRLANYGADPMSMAQAELARFVTSESEGAARIVKAAGIKPQ